MEDIREEIRSSQSKLMGQIDNSKTQNKIIYFKGMNGSLGGCPSQSSPVTHIISHSHPIEKINKNTT